MPRPALEVAEIFRTHGAAWRATRSGSTPHDLLLALP